ncbi:helix-turn-helix transcriptional regulator [Bacillus sp. mrc49]|uniref:helix-turn-helix transcriptional regulator n=1 Tax=Bacillus sp. mrc49 TaxID=2054913 RepID=UPI000C271F8A|nr:DNA-binding protein [Bacillus sp. mrc49]PJN91559.1 DNA-binding protein [Bacillus sp. mrc49]
MELTPEIKALIVDEVLTKPEVLDLLGLTRQSMHSHLKRGHIQPFKESGNTQLFFKEDVMKFKDSLEEKRKLFRPYDEKE